MGLELFTKRTVVQASAMDAFKWHERPGALERLTPPWQKMKVSMQGTGIPVGKRVTMTNVFWGVPVKMESEHTDYKEGVYFQDKMIRGPFQSWTHHHSFGEEKNNASTLEDKIEYQLPWYFPWFVKSMVKKELVRIFNYRHSVFANDINRHAGDTEPLTILISGASGLIGSTLIPFFTTGGHRVLTLVRRKADHSKNELFWDPAAGKLDLESAGKIDVVINLNGSPIAEGRWTKARRKKIIESRTTSTLLLAEKIAELKEKPELFLSSSAIGYYGDCGDRSITENDPEGDLFISDVCKKWENAAEKAVNAGVRTVFGRIGIVLTPNGGALEKLLPGFMMGGGAKLSKGEQYMSWISLEDIVGAVWHIIKTKNINGPVNLCGPSPVTNKEFTKTLGRVLSRPAFLFVPSWVVNLIWGEMGVELLLSGANVTPSRLLETGYDFSHKTLEEALSAELGK